MGSSPTSSCPIGSSYNKFGERYLDYSLPWDRIEGVGYKDGLMRAVDADLTAKSQARVAKDEDFEEIQRSRRSHWVNVSSNTRQSLLLADGDSRNARNSRVSGAARMA